MASLVSIIVPVRNSQQYIKALLDSLFNQDYPRFEVILVGNVGDKTWEPISEYIQDGQVSIIEVPLPPNWRGRDSNMKRNMGALYAHGDILVFTDQKIRHPSDWISRGVALLSQHNVHAVAGTMLSTQADSDSFWSRFTDGALVKRNPEFPSTRFLTASNFGAAESLPITANWFMTKEAYQKMGSFPEDFRDSYEDYAGAWQAVRNGVTFYCTSTLNVYHQHRVDPRQIQREYVRSARGAAQLFMTFTDCPFGWRRLVQVVAVSLFILITFAVLIKGVVFAEWLTLAAFALLGVTGLVAGSYLNYRKVGHWHGFLFPPITFYFILVFTWHFLYKIMEGIAVPTSDRFITTTDRFLQT
jgi:glycosyltransferase involved in cell wall biosynthesis